MADIKLRIEVNPDAETETLGTITNKINATGTNTNLSNTSFKANSNGVYIDTSNPKENGREMLSWGENGILKFDSAGNLSSNGVDAGYLASETEPDEFVWGVVPSTKKYSVKLTFSNATSLKDIVVYGDSTAKQFPTKAIIDGTKTIYSDDPKWAINMENESDTHTIEFTDWNRANYNACLTNIMVMLRYFDLDKGWIDSVESLSQSTSDPSSIQYGAIANSGSVTIRDLDGEIEDYINDGIISNSNVKTKLMINDNQVQEHILTDSDYNTNKKIFSMQMSNNIRHWDTLIYQGRNLTENESAYTLLCEVLNSLGYDNNHINNMMSSYIKSYLSLINIPYAYLSKDTYTNTINKFCTIAQLQLLVDEDNNPIFTNARPILNLANLNKVITIPKYSIKSSLQKDIIIKNKYDGVGISENVANVKRQLNEIVYSQNGIIANSNILQMLYNTNDNKHVRVDTYYSKGIVQIPKKSNYGLGNITNIHNNFDYSINYTNKNIYQADSAVDKNSAILYMKSITIPLVYEDLLNITPFVNSDETITSGQAKTYQISQLGETWFSTLSFNDETKDVVYKIGDYTSVSFKDNSNIKIEDRGDYYEIDYNILSRLFLCGLSGLGSGQIGDTGWYFDEILLNSINLDLYGDKYTIELSAIDVSTDNIEKAKTPIQISTNELMQSGTKIGDTKISSIIKDSILHDYKDGIHSGNIDLFCLDFYNSNNQKVIDWSNGEILKPIDEIKIQDAPNYWRITGRNIKFSGSPSISANIQESILQENICKINKPNTEGTGVTIITKDLYNNFIHDGDEIPYGTILNINIDFPTSYVIDWLKINNKEVNLDNYTYNLYVSENITLSIKYHYIKEDYSELDTTSATSLLYNPNGFVLTKGNSGFEVRVGIRGTVGDITRYAYTGFNTLSDIYQTGQFSDDDFGEFDISLNNNTLNVSNVNLTTQKTIRVYYNYREFNIL